MRSLSEALKTPTGSPSLRISSVVKSTWRNDQGPPLRTTRPNLSSLGKSSRAGGAGPSASSSSRNDVSSLLVRAAVLPLVLPNPIARPSNRQPTDQTLLPPPWILSTTLPSAGFQRYVS